MGLTNTIRFISAHPLNRGARIRALGRFAWWQVRSRLARETEVPFVNSARLLVSRGQTGATGNVYTGLHEVDEMGFAIHLLRPPDLFVDVGANVGSYTVLAAGAVGCRCLSFEPDVRTAGSLARNVAINGVGERVDIRRLALGASEGEVHFTAGFDTLNHVATLEERASAVMVRMSTLDTELGTASPTLIKIDVEGFEQEVLKGAVRTLGNPALLAVIIETNGSGERYLASDDDVHSVMIRNGFIPCGYDALNRKLEALTAPRSGGNTIYVRDFSAAAARTAAAPRFDVAGRCTI